MITDSAYRFSGYASEIEALEQYEREELFELLIAHIRAFMKKEITKNSYYIEVARREECRVLPRKRTSSRVSEVGSEVVGYLNKDSQNADLKCSSIY